MTEVTGEMLHQELGAAARAAGVSIQKFSTPLFNEPNWKLEQLRIAKHPKPSTIARVRALVAGEPLPPPSGNQYCRDARAFGLSRIEAEKAGIPPSSRSINESRNLELQQQRRSAAEYARYLADVARETRRPGQTLADRVRELRAETASPRRG